MDYSDRLAQAQGRHASGLDKVANTPAPDDQKFPIGATVRIADDLGLCMSHFPGKGKEAIVGYTYAHAYGGGNVKSYSLIIGGSSSAWYLEHQLTLVES